MANAAHTSDPVPFRERARALVKAWRPREERGTLLLVTLWVLAMVAVPIMRWTADEAGLTFGIQLGTILQASAAVVVVAGAWGERRAIRLAAFVILFGWLAEYIGHTTGFPFGGYAYTDRLQPQIGGVPILIPIAWLMMMPSAWAVADVLLKGRRGWRFVALSALAFTVWDLFLDPQMVLWNVWRFDDPGTMNYLGIPISNYLGWLLVSGLITALADRVFRVRDLPLPPLLLIYTITWVLQTIGQIVFWGLPISGIIGGAAMGVFVIAAWRAFLRRGAGEGGR